MNKELPNVVRAVCYLRKSREDEEAEKRGEDTLAKQREMMVRDVLPRYNFDYDIAEEVASGDSIRERPVFQSILLRLGREYQAIICKDLSRLGRGSYGDMGQVYDVIRDRRIFIITKDSVYDPTNFSDLRMIRFSMFFNREEYEMTLWRLTEGKYDGASKGKWVAGTVPFGFQYEHKTQVLIANEEDAKVVRLVFDMYVNDGLGFRSIATKLRRLGYLSPRGKEIWQPEVIHRMLKNPAYNGTLVFRKTQRRKSDGRVVRRPAEEHIVVEHAFDAIVDEETWNKAQDRLQMGQSKPKVKLDFSPCELAGLIRCSKCKRKMVRQSSTQHYTKRDGSRSCYEKEFLYCVDCGYSIKYRDCEAQLLMSMKDWTLLDEHLLNEKLQQMAQNRDDDKKPSIHEVVKNLEDKKEKIIQRLERARDLLLDGTFSKDEYRLAKMKCERDIDEVKESIALAKAQTLNKPTDIPSFDVDQIRRNIHSFLDIYGQLTDKSRRNTLLRSIFDDIELEFIKKGTGKNNPTRFNLYVRFDPRVF